MKRFGVLLASAALGAAVAATGPALAFGGGHGGGFGGGHMGGGFGGPHMGGGHMGGGFRPHFAGSRDRFGVGGGDLGLYDSCDYLWPDYNPDSYACNLY